MYEERPKLVQTVSWAASNGDRSENGDYIYGKRRLREIDRRVHFLNQRLDSAVIVDPAKQNSSKVLFGATLEVRYSDGTEATLSIVGADETDASLGRISWQSPMAKALLGAEAGDEVSFRTPQGEREVEILSIRYG